MGSDRAVWHSQNTIPSDPAAGRRVMDEVLAKLEHLGWVSRDIFSIHLAMEEALVNAIKHGNRHDADKQVHVQCKIFDDRIWIEVRDEGPGFEPEEVPDPTDDENLDTASGRGLMLIRSFMSSVEYTPPGNRVVMEKARAAPEASEHESAG